MIWTFLNLYKKRMMLSEADTYVKRCHIGHSCSILCLDVSFFILYAVSDPGLWTPPVTARPLKGGAIEVKIGHSPSDFNLTQFQVTLVKRSFDQYKAFETTFYTEPVSLLIRMLRCIQTRFTRSTNFIYVSKSIGNFVYALPSSHQ